MDSGKIGRIAERFTRTAGAVLVIMLTTGGVMAQQRIRIVTDWGELTATLADNAASRALAAQLPLTLAMQDHLRQEKVGTLTQDLPEIGRQRGFEPGTLGIWRNDRFVIYYVKGEVPNPGIMIVGRVEGNAAILNRPGPVHARIEAIR